MTIEIVDFPINSMVDLSIVTLNYQRVDWLCVHIFVGQLAFDKSLFESAILSQIPGTLPWPLAEIA